MQWRDLEGVVGGDGPLTGCVTDGGAIANRISEIVSRSWGKVRENESVGFFFSWFVTIITFRVLWGGVRICK